MQTCLSEDFSSRFFAKYSQMLLLHGNHIYLFDNYCQLIVLCNIPGQEPAMLYLPGICTICYFTRNFCDILNQFLFQNKNQDKLCLYKLFPSSFLKARRLGWTNWWDRWGIHYCYNQVCTLESLQLFHAIKSVVADRTNLSVKLRGGIVHLSLLILYYLNFILNTYSIKKFLH